MTKCWLESDRPICNPEVSLKQNLWVAAWKIPFQGTTQSFEV